MLSTAHFTCRASAWLPARRHEPRPPSRRDPPRARAALPFQKDRCGPLEHPAPAPRRDHESGVIGGNHDVGAGGLGGLGARASRVSDSEYDPRDLQPAGRCAAQRRRDRRCDPRNASPERFRAQRSLPGEPSVHRLKKRRRHDPQVRLQRLPAAREFFPGLLV
jgi:hypothetical protein